MKKLIILFSSLILISCEYKEVPVSLSNKDVLYISSAYRDYHGGGRFPIKYVQRFIVSSTPSSRDTVMILEYTVPDDKTPLKYNLGDTLHLNFKR